jgi:predicted O-linked N-acetylglucosamine transferase (SPINDLY family)
MSTDRRQSTQLPEAMQRLRQAYDLHRRGALADAEKLYASILQSDPALFDALHLFGVLRMQQGRPAEALPLIDAALAQRPDSLDALSTSAAALINLGRSAEALPKLDRLIALRPNDAGAHFNRGIALTALARNEEAIASYRKTLAVEPSHLAALFNVGNVLAMAGRYDEALGCYDRVLTAVPNHHDALNNRGNALAKLGQHEAAVAAYGRVLAMRPNDLRALTNRANALKSSGRFADALADYDRVLAIDPHHADALYNRGNTLLDLRSPQAAEENLARAIALRPDEADFHISRAAALFELRRPHESVESYRRALALRPRDPVLHSDLIFALNFDPAATPAVQQAERALWDERHARPFAASIKPHSNNRDPHRRLRVGYVSAHFRQQAGTFAFGGVLTHHDRRAFEIVCYSDTRQEDELTPRLRACADLWHRTSELTDDQLAELIRSDRIDILVELAGHMQGSRLLVCARKPAPIQLNGWGEPTGSGLRTIDFLLADQVLVPPTERAQFADRIADLPCTIAYWVPDPLPQPAPLPALVRGYVTFGSFNRLSKVLDPVLRTWSEILRATPQSRLVLKDRLLDQASQQTPILNLLGEQGIDADRVSFLDQTSRSAHFSALHEIDIALDPFPHGGGMTTLDALWMGVPVVTWPGRTASSRVAAACLTAVGLTDFIARDPASYAQLAIAKASDLDNLVQLRGRLREQVAGSPVGNLERYTRAVEAVYRGLWQRWCASAM